MTGDVKFRLWEKVLIYGFLAASLLLFMLASRGVFAETYNITISAHTSEVEATMSALLIANCTDSLGANHEDNITFTVGGVDFVFNEYTDLYYGVATRNTPATVEFGVLTVFTDSENGTSTGAVIQNATITWTTGTFDVLKPFLITGDLLGAFAAIPAQLLGASVFWTLFMVGLSGAIYSYYGPERTFVVWLIGWGLFSGVVRGEAAMFGLFLLSLGGGLIMAKMWMDRRSS